MTTYDPEVGRFVSQDPIGLSGGINFYQYALNPTAWIDPLGLSGCLLNFANAAKLAGHFEKHGTEFGAKTEAEYLQVGRDIIQHGEKVEYFYRPAGKMRTGYVQFMGNNSKGQAKFGFVGTNTAGEIEVPSIFHLPSGELYAARTQAEMDMPLQILLSWK